MFRRLSSPSLYTEEEVLDDDSAASSPRWFWPETVRNPPPPPAIVNAALHSAARRMPAPITARRIQSHRGSSTELPWRHDAADISSETESTLKVPIENKTTMQRRMQDADSSPIGAWPPPQDFESESDAHPQFMCASSNESGAESSEAELPLHSITRHTHTTTTTTHITPQAALQPSLAAVDAVRPRSPVPRAAKAVINDRPITDRPPPAPDNDKRASERPILRTVTRIARGDIRRFSSNLRVSPLASPTRPRRFAPDGTVRGDSASAIILRPRADGEEEQRRRTGDPSSALKLNGIDRLKLSHSRDPRRDTPSSAVTGLRPVDSRGYTTFNDVDNNEFYEENGAARRIRPSEPGSGLEMSHRVSAIPNAVTPRRSALEAATRRQAGFARAIRADYGGGGPSADREDADERRRQMEVEAKERVRQVEAAEERRRQVEAAEDRRRQAEMAAEDRRRQLEMAAEERRRQAEAAADVEDRRRRQTEAEDNRRRAVETEERRRQQELEERRRLISEDDRRRQSPLSQYDEETTVSAAAARMVSLMKEGDETARRDQERRDRRRMESLAKDAALPGLLSAKRSTHDRKLLSARHSSTNRPRAETTSRRLATAESPKRRATEQKALLSGEKDTPVQRTERHIPAPQSSGMATLKQVMSQVSSTVLSSNGAGAAPGGFDPSLVQGPILRDLRSRQIPITSVLRHADIHFALSPSAGQSNTISFPGASPADLQRRGYSLYKINSGTFCSVFRAHCRGKDVAVKCPDENLLKSDGDMMRYRALQEWRILSRTNHPRILNFHGGVILRDQLWLVTDFVKGGDLYTLLYHRPPEYLRPRIRLSLMEQLCEAVAYLHGLKPRIAHKDLKCNNLLVGEDLELRVCDFGDAEEMSSRFLQCCTAATWQYTPPELIGTEDPSRPKDATEKVDIWAVGCVFLEILRCATPFVHILDSVSEDKQRDILRQCYLEGRLEMECRVPVHLPPRLRAIIKSCLHFDAYLRPSAAELLVTIRSCRDALIAEVATWQSQWEAMQQFKSAGSEKFINGKSSMHTNNHPEYPTKPTLVAPQNQLNQPAKLPTNEYGIKAKQHSEYRREHRRPSMRTVTSTWEDGGRATSRAPMALQRPPNLELWSNSRVRPHYAESTESTASRTRQRPSFERQSESRTLGSVATAHHTVMPPRLTADEDAFTRRHLPLPPPPPPPAAPFAGLAKSHGGADRRALMGFVTTRGPAAVLPRPEPESTYQAITARTGGAFQTLLPAVVSHDGGRVCQSAFSDRASRERLYHPPGISFASPLSPRLTMPDPRQQPPPFVLYTTTNPSPPPPLLPPNLEDGRWRAPSRPAVFPPI